MEGSFGNCRHFSRFERVSFPLREYKYLRAAAAAGGGEMGAEKSKKTGKCTKKRRVVYSVDSK